MAGEKGSIPGESPYDSVFGHTVEGHIIPESTGSALDDTLSANYVDNWRALGDLVLPHTTEDPLFDGRASMILNQSTELEGEQ